MGEKKMLQCMVRCFDSSNAIKTVHHCHENCQKGPQLTSKKVQNEMESLQKSVGSCVQTVAQRLEPRLQISPDDSALRAEFEQGLVQCVKIQKHSCPIWNDEFLVTSG